MTTYLTISLVSLWLGFALQAWLNRHQAREIAFYRSSAGMWFRHYRSLCREEDQE